MKAGRLGWDQGVSSFKGSEREVSLYICHSEIVPTQSNHLMISYRLLLHK